MAGSGSVAVERAHLGVRSAAVDAPKDISAVPSAVFADMVARHLKGSLAVGKDRLGVGAGTGVEENSFELAVVAAAGRASMMVAGYEGMAGQAAAAVADMDTEVVVEGRAAVGSGAASAAHQQCRSSIPWLPSR